MRCDSKKNGHSKPKPGMCVYECVCVCVWVCFKQMREFVCTTEIERESTKISSHKNSI